MTEERLTYAKAGKTPEDWMWLKVYDLDANEYLDAVIEVNTEEGWAVCFKKVGDQIVNELERLSGNYRIERHYSHEQS